MTTFSIRSTVYLLILLILLPILACGDDNTDPVDTPPIRQGLAPELLPQALHDLYCEAVWQCNNRMTRNPYLLYVFGRYESEEACKEAYGEPAAYSYVALQTDEFLDAIADERIQYNGSRASSCLTAFKSKLCQLDTEGRPPECVALYRGVVNEDMPCVKNNNECADNLVCKSSSPMECHGTCQELQIACGNTSCTTEEFCNHTTSSCESRKAVGEVCQDSVECVASALCNKPGQANVAPENVIGMCTKKGELQRDDPCSSSELCAPTLTCVDEICRPVHTGARGAPCDLNFGCQPGLTCSNIGEEEQSGSCRKPASENENCTFHFECAPGLQCQRNEFEALGSCQALLTDGQSCSDSFECASAYCSIAKKCAPLLACTIPN